MGVLVNHDPHDVQRRVSVGSSGGSDLSPAVFGVQPLSVSGLECVVIPSEALLPDWIVLNDNDGVDSGIDRPVGKSTLGVLNHLSVLGEHPLCFLVVQNAACPIEGDLDANFSQHCPKNELRIQK